MKQLIISRPHLFPSLLACGMLLAATGRWPYGYYTLLRFVVCAAAVFVAYEGYVWRSLWACWLFGFIAALFNPLVPVHLRRSTWQPLDILAAAAFLIAVFVLKAPGEREAE